MGRRRLLQLVTDYSWNKFFLGTQRDGDAKQVNPIGRLLNQKLYKWFTRVKWEYGNTKIV